ncbi:hypothetical protein ACOME3_001287 [Neoechinorhynchus agilis]
MLGYNSFKSVENSYNNLDTLEQDEFNNDAITLALSQGSEYSSDQDPVYVEFDSYEVINPDSPTEYKMHLRMFIDLTCETCIETITEKLSKELTIVLSASTVVLPAGGKVEFIDSNTRLSHDQALSFYENREAIDPEKFTTPAPVPQN